MGSSNHAKAIFRRAEDRSGGSKAYWDEDYQPRRSNRIKSSPESPSQVTLQNERSSPETRGKHKELDGQPVKKRPKPVHGNIEDYDDEYLNSPMNDSERSEWKGWCEIESDPAFFNAIVKEWGVRGVKIQEVIGLDDELLTFLPKPVYGLIFLFEYREDSPEKMERCPNNVWFAHQIAQNSCASVALLNLIMNIPHIDVGDVVENLRSRTATDTSPQQRGQVVKNCEFIRNVHNSFARKSDLFVEVKDMKQPKTPQKTTRRKARFANKKRKKVTEEEEENAFHFISFVPINGKLWKLDGMDAQPMNLGPFEDDWMDLARPEISARMAAYEDDAISFSLQAVCCSPLETLPALLAENIAQLISIESELATRDPDWSIYIDPDASTIAASHLLLGPDQDTCVTAELLTRAKYNLETIENAHPKITRCDNSVMELMDMREKVVKEQHKLRGAYMEEIVAVQLDEERTKNRRRSREEAFGIGAPEASSPTSNRDYSAEKQAPSDPVEEYQLPTTPVQKDTPGTEATDPPDIEPDSGSEMKDLITEKQGSESSLDIPLNTALTINSDGPASYLDRA